MNSNFWSPAPASTQNPRMPDLGEESWELAPAQRDQGLRKGFSERLYARAGNSLIGMANDGEQDFANPKTKLAHL